MSGLARRGRRGLRIASSSRRVAGVELGLVQQPAEGEDVRGSDGYVGAADDQLEQGRASGPVHGHPARCAATRAFAEEAATVPTES